MAVNRKIDNRSTAGLGSRRRTFHTTMLIDPTLRAEESANESVGHARIYNSSIGTKITLRVFTDHKLYKIRKGRQTIFMTWIRAVPLASADEKLLKAMEAQRDLYPIEYATPVHPVEGGGSQIVASHSLIPEALYHAFSTFGVLMSPELPLSRRQHEMIATIVSVTNRCVY
jgi:hypothetical protein